jgi:hypothetical protein
LLAIDVVDFLCIVPKWGQNFSLRCLNFNNYYLRSGCHGMQKKREKLSTARNSYLGISNELMNQAVIRVLNKKRDFAQSEARGGNSATVQSETPNMQNNGSDK